MNAENPVQIDLFGVSATRTKDTRLAEHIGGYARDPLEIGHSRRRAPAIKPSPVSAGRHACRQ
jgi:hypothetical protein